MLPWVPFVRRSRQLCSSLFNIERDGIDVQCRHARFSCQVCHHLPSLCFACLDTSVSVLQGSVCWWVYEKDRPLLEEDGTSSPEQHFGSHGAATVRSACDSNGYGKPHNTGRVVIPIPKRLGGNALAVVVAN
jgi:rubredoxin